MAGVYRGDGFIQAGGPHHRGHRAGDEVLQESGWGDGPVDAAYKAIDLITKIPCRLTEYRLQALTAGKDALGEVVVAVEVNGLKVVGKGNSTDVIEASARAYLSALNRVARTAAHRVKEVGP